MIQKKVGSAKLNIIYWCSRFHKVSHTSLDSKIEADTPTGFLRTKAMESIPIERQQATLWKANMHIGDFIFKRKNEASVNLLIIYLFRWWIDYKIANKLDNNIDGSEILHHLGSIKPCK